MTFGDRRKSIDRIHLNSRLEGDHSDDEALLNDIQPLSLPESEANSQNDEPQTLDPAPTSEGDGQHQGAGPSRRRSSIDEADNVSTLTLRRGSNPENLLPTAGRSQPGDEPERREEAPQPIDRQPRHPQVRFDPQQDQVKIIMDTPPPQPQSSESPQQRKSEPDAEKLGTVMILGLACAAILFLMVVGIIYCVRDPGRT
ncbi:uncharacterized protein LOC106653487 [Trichogramma pretiosum]|uniref:uncharacterized protein LOC106653487 n=1 Tax=Trichogramma pretiosum TaxID=7493 RepID=UPI0006C952B4|nr:uncharacterized protein LOC106653487 [Trichogramma pretiosum]